MPKKKKKNNPDWLVKAYNNYDFLNSSQGRPLRILAEFLEPSARFRKHKVKNTVVFFGSARALPINDAKKTLKKVEAKIKKSSVISHRLKKELQNAKQDILLSRYYEDAVKLSEKLTHWLKTLEGKGKHFHVCSGGGPGIMEAANRGAVNAKGDSLGLNISLPTEQTPNAYQTKEISCEFHYFFIRKFWFFYLAKALVVFPGGYGTMDEFFELLTVIQTEKTSKHMPIVLYGKKYWNEIVNFNALLKWGVISRADLSLFKIEDDVESAFKYLKKEINTHFLSKK